MSQFKTNYLIVILVSCILFIGGCSQPEIQVYPVNGTVTHQGQPAVGAIVLLKPESGNEVLAHCSKHGFPSGAVGIDGKFSITTPALKNAMSGAPPGQYAVLIFWPVMQDSTEEEAEQLTLTPDKLNGMYNDPINPKFRITLEAKENSMAAMNL